MTTTERLMPCPFCGNRNVAQGSSGDYISVWCGCGARGPDVPFPEIGDPLPPILECHAKWNTRALSSTLEAPADWVLVPREPTEAMLHAGGQARMYPSVHMSGPSAMAQREAYRIYRAMIAAIGPVMNPCPECGKEIEQCPH